MHVQGPNGKYVGTVPIEPFPLSQFLSLEQAPFLTSTDTFKCGYKVIFSTKGVIGPATDCG